MRTIGILLYRVALRTHPAEFRARFGDRMVADVRELLQERGATGGLWVALREATDVVRASVRERRRGADLGLGPSRPPGRFEGVRLAVDDATFAARSLRARPGYAIVSILTLALGIGASTTVFSVVDKVVIEPLPFPGSDRLVYLWASDLTRPRPTRMPTTPGDFTDWRSLSDSFDFITAIRGAGAVLTGGSHPERVSITEITDDSFRMLGAAPHLGALLGSDSSPTDIVLSHATWQQLFAGDPAIVGRVIQLNGAPHTIVGVTDASFRHPWGRSTMWRPLRFDGGEATNRNSRSLIVLARRKASVTSEQALDEMTRVTAGIAEAHPETNENWGIHLLGAKDLYLENSRQMYMMLAAAVALVMLIASVNLASLVLARGASRQTEIAVRMALGAGRRRIARLLAVEGILIAGAGTAVGVLLATWGLAAVLQFAPRWPAVLHESTITARGVLFAAGTALLALMLFSLLPALRLTRAGGGQALRGASRVASASRLDLRFRRGLIVGQMALALVLMVGAALLTRSVVNILNSNTGFDYRNVITARVTMTPSAADDVVHSDAVSARTLSRVGGTDPSNFFEQLLERVGNLPGVSKAAIADSAPLEGTGDWVRVFIDGERAMEDRALGADYRRVSVEYFDTLQISTVAGRLLAPSDADGEPVAVINEDFARRFLTGREPIGASVEIAPSTGGDTDQLATYRVVGVVPTVQEWGPGSFPIPMIYVLHQTDPSRTMTLMLRTDAGAAGLVDPIRNAVREVGDGPVERVRALSTYFRATYESQAFMLALLGSFAGLATLLSGIGLYGVMAYHVLQRRREIGVRVALGARAADVARMVLRQGALMAGLAIGLGLLGAIPAARALSTLSMGTLLVDMHWLDPAVFLSVSVVVLISAVAASWIPARRAARVDPVEALRSEA